MYRRGGSDVHTRSGAFLFRIAFCAEQGPHTTLPQLRQWCLPRCISKHVGECEHQYINATHTIIEKSTTHCVGPEWPYFQRINVISKSGHSAVRCSQARNRLQKGKEPRTLHHGESVVATLHHTLLHFRVWYPQRT